MWIAGGLVWFLLIMLELLLGIFFGSTHAWTPIFVPLIVIGVMTGGTFWMLGTMRAVQLVRAGRRQSTSGSPPGVVCPDLCARLNAGGHLRQRRGHERWRTRLARRFPAAFCELIADPAGPCDDHV
jgi:hypothetical protein